MKKYIAVNSGTDSALGEWSHRKQVDIELCLAYREGWPAIVISPISNFINSINSDNGYVNRSIYCIISLVQDSKLTVTC